jgi:hypothetical protein
MPLIAPAGGEKLTGLHVRLPGLPDFNAEVSMVISDITDFYSVAKPNAVLVSNGGGPGAVATGDWELTEINMSLVGQIRTASPADIPAFRAALLKALPPSPDTPLIVVGNDWDIDRQMFVRRYDKPEIGWVKKRLTFTIPLVAPDPYKYALEPLGGQVGVFAGTEWFRTYADDGAGTWERTYTGAAGEWYRTYAQVGSLGAFPLALGLDSDGDAASRRVTVTVNGPVPAGWWVENTTTGTRLWTELALTEGQTLLYDCRRRTARLNGADVSHLTFGDFLTLEPGGNTFRLIAPSDLGGWADFAALPAYL